MKLLLNHHFYITFLSSICLSVFAVPVNAKPITVTAQGHNSVPKYTNAPHMPYANPKAPKGGTLSLYQLGTFDSLNAYIDQGTAADGVDYLYDSLMSGSLDEAFAQYPQLAEKVTYDPDDASWIIYHVNPKARFSDGSSVTADDVAATFETYLSKGRMAWRSYLSGLKEVKALDKYRAKFIFKTDQNKEIGLSVGQLPIFAKKSLGANFEKVQLKPLIGSGAYKVSKVDPGRAITYERDPNYWGRDVMINRGRYNVDRIKYTYYQSSEIAFEGFKAGQYRWRSENKARNWATQYNFPAVKAGMVKKETIDNRNPMPMQGLVMNLRRPLFQDIKVRKAITHAFDFEWMNRQLFYNIYERQQSYFHNSELAATGKPSAAEMAVLKPLLPSLHPVHREAVLNEWKAPKSNGNGFNRSNLLIARQLLLDAKFSYKRKNGKIQLYQPNGKPAKFEILIASQGMERVVLSFVRNMRRLGFDVSVRLLDVPQYVQRKREFDYDMVVEGIRQGLSPGQEQLYLWGSEAADQQGNRNSAGIKNKAIDTVIDKLVHAHSREGIILYTKVLDRLLRGGYYMVPMYNKSVFQVAYWDEYRHPKRLPSNAIGLDYWWVDKAAEKKVNAYLDGE